MIFNSGRCIAAMLAILLLGACLGGGGSPSPSPSPSPDGSDELTLPENGTANFDGIAVVVPFSIDASDEVTLGTITSEVDSTVSLTTSNNEIVKAVFEATGTSVSADVPDSRGRLGNVDVVGLTTAEENEDALIIEPSKQGFKYQTFGVWLNIPDSAPGTGSAGAGVYGEPTETTNMPSSGTATYSGASIGISSVPDEGEFATASQIEVTTDFRTATITSSNTHRLNLDTDVIGAVPEWNFSGTGNVTGAGFKADINGMEITNGTANGHFFGPNAEEVGGTFSGVFQVGGGYIGSFGAAK